MTFRTAAALAAVTAGLALAAPAMAQSNPAPGDPAVAAGPLDPASLSRDRITILGGVATLPSYEGSDNNNFIPAAAIQGTISGYAFSTRGLYLYVDVLRNAPGPVVDLQLGPVVGLNLDRNRLKSIDDAEVEALGKRKIGVDVGGFVGIGKTGVITSDYDKLTASVTYIRNVNNASDSYVITPSIDYGTPLSTKAYVGLSGSGNYVGGKYADYYFSVTNPGSLFSGLPLFNADKGWKDFSVSGFVNYSLTGDLLHGLGLVVGGRYSRLLNDFARSPIVSIAGDRNQYSGTVGLSYTF